MTSATPAHLSLPAYVWPQKVTQARVLRSEWTKLRTQPGALWSLLSAVILVAAVGIGYSLLREARPPQGAAAIRSFDPVAVSLSGAELAQIAAGVLGVLVITSEYATGLIRTTLAAVPRRLPVLWGKAAMLAAATLTVSLPAAFVAFAAGLAVTTVRPDPASSLAPWAGFGVFCLYAAVLLSLAAVRMRRGDA